jgi:hypothetical protein
MVTMLIKIIYSLGGVTPALLSITGFFCGGEERSLNLRGAKF